MRLAVLKPDHVGDLVLSSPAIRALARVYPDLVLFVGSSCLGVASALFPEVALETLDLPHLSKAGGLKRVAINFRHFDALAILRQDGVITPAWAALRAQRYAMPVDTHGDHQSLLDYGVAREFVEPYDIDQLFYGDRRAEVERKGLMEPTSIGLSIGSGFYANAWPLVHWIDLGRRLKAEGRAVKVVHGPAERPLAAVLLQEIGLRAGDLIEGGDDVDSFLDQISGLDLVVASDGGTAHLCSLAVPILSIFGPSPLQRYSPFGPWNRTLSQLLPCSPCLQYSQTLINGCLSVECMSLVTAHDVLTAIQRPVSKQDIGGRERLRPGLTLFKGLSHADRDRKIRRRENEHRMWAPNP